ncbi:MAG TPA: 2-polyprenyl-3-methyl-6-methoxy-1,4-benzoquinone monooxygenase [Gammaproteobacteria bacterium]|nr:2-polyprenyl-3-methyl-6-methoxy-1,4-benzoquinone monooxygenase [Gammaproteobacteria bacterium]
MSLPPPPTERRPEPAPSWVDRLIGALDEGLRALAAPTTASRLSPAAALPDADLTAEERHRSAALMRVNHAGEIAAQALYHGQSLLARDPATRRLLATAACEERDHLAWCAERIDELGGRPSVLAPLWYTGSFLIGVVAAANSDAVSLGFVNETERQVEAHLRDHLHRLPGNDRKSAAILEQMAVDEAHHGTTATLAGGVELPGPVRRCMRLGGEILRRVALRV